MRRFASPYATAIWNAMERESNMPDHEVPYDGFHIPCRLSPDDFDRGIRWLIHFNYIDKFSLHGQIRIRQNPSQKDQGKPDLVRLFN